MCVEGTSEGCLSHFQSPNIDKIAHHKYDIYVLLGTQMFELILVKGTNIQ